MSTHTDKTQKNTSSTNRQSAAHQTAQMQTDDTSPFYFEDNRPKKSQAIQMKALMDNYIPKNAIQRKENNTGLPDNLKTGIENLSGHSMDDVKVHYNSDKPAQLNAHAYAQGTDIHLGSGQEKHLPHEAWHVVQQKQGRVQPTLQMKGKVNVNDEEHLEKEADEKGLLSLQESEKEVIQSKKSLIDKKIETSNVIQGYFTFDDSDKKIYNVPKLYRIEGQIEPNEILESWGKDEAKEHHFNSWDYAIDAVMEIVNLGKEPKSIGENFDEMITSLIDKGSSLDWLSEKSGSILTGLKGPDDTVYSNVSGHLYELLQQQKLYGEEGIEVLDQTKKADTLYKKGETITAVQHKFVTGNTWAKRLKDALEQLTGRAGEKPPKGSTLVADLALDPNASTFFNLLNEDGVTAEIIKQMQDGPGKHFGKGTKVEVKITYFPDPSLKESNQLVYDIVSGKSITKKEGGSIRRPEMNTTIEYSKKMAELESSARKGITMSPEISIDMEKERLKWSEFWKIGSNRKFGENLNKYYKSNATDLLPTGLLSEKDWLNKNMGESVFHLKYNEADKAYNNLMKESVTSFNSGLVKGKKWEDALYYI